MNLNKWKSVVLASRSFHGVIRETVWSQQMSLCPWEKVTSLVLDVSCNFCFTLWLMIFLYPGQPFTDVCERPEQGNLNSRRTDSLSLTLPYLAYCLFSLVILLVLFVAVSVLWKNRLSFFFFKQHIDSPLNVHRSVQSILGHSNASITVVKDFL